MSFPVHTVEKFSCGGRRGSALLIVLGFLSFMVVSAVSFAIYMRSERMPSSVFRRDVQARHLVKAALARAISEIDDAIREDPIPVGVERGWAVRIGEGSSSASGTGKYETDWMRQYERQTRSRYFNRWMGRVFMPPNPDNESDYGLMAPSSQTTPVLNLEALGYLPPAVMNDVRILSRGTWSAKWKNFDYGAGRYAYCAVDVSDFFDINRVPVDSPRTSQDRINLVHLFAQKDSVDKGINDLGDFADFIEKRGKESKMKDYPFVSMMDYNLALGARGGGAKLRSPFCNWLGRGTSPADFYSDINGGDPLSSSDDWMRCKNSVFVTDSWFPPDSCQYDISGNCREPFTKAQVERESFGLNDMNAAMASQFANAFNNNLTPLDLCSLYDYLDRDDVPLSLSLPCVERVPMVAAIQPKIGFKIQIQKQPPQEIAEGTKKHTVTDYKVTEDIVAPNGELSCAIVFPFRHGSQLNGTFRARAFVRVFLAEAGIKRRYESDVLSLRPPDDDVDWTKTYDAFKLGGNDRVLAFTLVSPVENIAFGEVNTEDDIHKTVLFRGFTMPSTIPSDPLFSKRETQDYTPEGLPSGSPKTEWKINYSPLKAAGGKVIADAGTDKWITDEAFNGIKDQQFMPYVAVWVRIENSNGDVVDLVPAMPKDDDLNNGDTSGARNIWRFVPNEISHCPYLLFATETANAYAFATSLVETPYDRPAMPGTWSPEALVTLDPRFNYAPEDWYGAAYQADIGQYWLDEVQNELGNEGRDDDPFLFVSNQGYLQSLGELAFLPRLSNFGKNDSAVLLSQLRQAESDGLADFTKLIVGGYDGELHAKAGLASRNCMWKSYRILPVGDNGDMEKYGSDGIFQRSDITDGGHGFRVNPFTTVTNVMFAALANTPYDWWAAGTNKVSAGGVNSRDPSTKGNQLSSIGNSLKFAFNESSGGSTRLEYKDLRKIAAFLMRRFEEAAASGHSWQEVYDNLDWLGGAGETLGQLYLASIWPGDGLKRMPTLRHNTDNSCSSDPFKGEVQDYGSDSDLGGGTSPAFYDNLTSADRKYLYAFWRNCFANKQQLFLVFVRAESTAMGGSGEGQVPAQQGGRAVALVWRDPTTPNGQTSNPGVNFDDWVPHRTRVLFYHQLD